MPDGMVLLPYFPPLIPPLAVIPCVDLCQASMAAESMFIYPNGREVRAGPPGQPSMPRPPSAQPKPFDDMDFNPPKGPGETMRQQVVPLHVVDSVVGVGVSCWPLLLAGLIVTSVYGCE